MKAIYSASVIALFLASIACESMTDQAVEDVPSVLDDYVVVDVRESLATLVIAPTVSDHADLTIANNYWVYMEGRIVATKRSPRDDPSSLDSFDIMLVPGEYELEVVVERSYGEVHFPFSFTSHTVLAEAGKSTTVDVSVEHDWEISFTLGFPNPGTTWDVWLQDLAKRVDQQSKDYQASKEAVAMHGAYTALQQSPPLQPVVWIEMPEHYGGGREFDAEQVRLIVGWLKRDNWDWFPTIYSNGRWSAYELPTAILAEYQRIGSVVSQNRDFINSLNEIADKLDKVEQ